MNWSWLLPSGKGIPVLMYHKVWPGVTDSLTITPEDMRQQWDLLKKEGYYTVSLPEYLDIATGEKSYTGKPLLLTFDDGYLNNQVYVYPLLKEFGWQGTFFIIANTLSGVTATDTGGPGQLMALEQLKRLDPAIVQLAMHGYAHENMGNATLAETQEALQLSLNAFESSGLAWHRVLAYPYGAMPGKHFPQLKRIMAEMGIKAAFRIGNKVSEVPAPDMYELKRIDIKGTDTVADFKIKIKKGKLKPF